MTIFTDGASKGNPGEAAVGVVLLEGGIEIATVSKPIGVATNNVAEYTALIYGLEKAKSLGYRKAQVFADSELMVKQLRGEYKVKNDGIKPLYKKVKELESCFSSLQYNHVYRASNERADYLANKALE